MKVNENRQHLYFKWDGVQRLGKRLESVFWVGPGLFMAHHELVRARLLHDYLPPEGAYNGAVRAAVKWKKIIENKQQLLWCWAGSGAAGGGWLNFDSAVSGRRAAGRAGTKRPPTATPRWLTLSRSGDASVNTQYCWRSTTTLPRSNMCYSSNSQYRGRVVMVTGRVGWGV